MHLNPSILLNNNWVSFYFIIPLRFSSKFASQGKKEREEENEIKFSQLKKSFTLKPS